MPATTTRQRVADKCGHRLPSRTATADLCAQASKELSNEGDDGVSHFHQVGSRNLGRVGDGVGLSAAKAIEGDGRATNVESSWLGSVSVRGKR